MRRADRLLKSGKRTVCDCLASNVRQPDQHVMVQINGQSLHSWRTLNVADLYFWVKCNHSPTWSKHSFGGWVLLSGFVGTRATKGSCFHLRFQLFLGTFGVVQSEFLFLSHHMQNTIHHIPTTWKDGGHTMAPTKDQTEARKFSCATGLRMNISHPHRDRVHQCTETKICSHELVAVEASQKTRTTAWNRGWMAERLIAY